MLEYHRIVSIWKPVAFCYSDKKYINIAERDQHSKVELIIISFNKKDTRIMLTDIVFDVFIFT